jgi:hypothetical protein
MVARQWARAGYAEHITEPARLISELKSIWRRGHAMDREERTSGAACVAVGIHDHLGKCTAAMSVSAPAVRFGATQRKTVLEHRRSAAELSAALGRPIIKEEIKKAGVPKTETIVYWRQSGQAGRCKLIASILKTAWRSSRVTGGARGIGLALVARFLDSGARVVVWDRDSDQPGEPLSRLFSDSLSSRRDSFKK